MDAPRAGGKALPLGPIALRLLARRRRWIRWAAVALACLTAASALSQAGHRHASRPAGAAAVVARRALLPGQLIRPADLHVTAMERPPAGPAPLSSVEDAAGRVAVRGLRAGEAVTPLNAVPPLQYYGVSVRIPPGMRAMNLVVPRSATFGGELAPLSRVDLLGAFEVGQERAAATLLTTGIILRVAPGSGTPGGAGGQPAAGGALDPARQAAFAELVVAVPPAREPEVALAQAFGRLFVAVHSAAAGASHAGVPGAVNLRRYLDLPAAASPPVLALPPAPPAWHPGPGALAAPGGGAGPARPPIRPRADAPPAWTVEVIRGGERSRTEVPRIRDASPSRAGREGEDP